MAPANPPTPLLALLPLTLLAPPAEPDPTPGARQESDLRPLTLDAIFGPDRLRAAPPQDVSWLPDGSGFVFRQAAREEDEREGTWLWRHDVATGERSALVDWDALRDELRARRPGWSEPVLDDVNRTGRFDFSPRLAPDGAALLGLEAGDLWLLDLARGEARFLTEGPEPELFFRFRPDGGAVAFARGNDLYLVDLDSGAERRLTDRGANDPVQNGVADWVYEEELGLQQSFWWSPDGARIAYLQFDTSPVSVFPITDELELVAGLERQRYPKAGTANPRVRLGVLDLASGDTTWVASGDAPEAYLVDAGWAEGHGLWYLWLDRDQTRLELRLVDAAGGTRALAVQEDERWVDVGPDPLFLGDGTFLWTSEESGWRHLYRYDVDGGRPARLTSGEWELDSIEGLVDGGNAVLYTSNEGRAVERHVYRVGLAGGDRRRVSRTPGWHAADVSPTGGYWLDHWSSTDVPPRVELVTAAGEPVRTVDDGGLPGLEGYRLGTAELELVSLGGGADAAEGGDLPLWTRTVYPHNFDPARRYPVIVHVYGGPGARLVRDVWRGQRALYRHYLAEQGAVVFTVDNRGSGGRGRDFARLLYRRLGSLEVEDQARAVRWLREQPWVDPERIGIYGGSYGGYLALHCLFRYPDLFRAGVSYAPVTDFRLYDTIYTERYLDTPDDNPAGYREGAPLEHVEGLEGALLLVHGTVDNNVHLQNTVQLLDRLARAQKDFELMLYPRTRHSMGDEDYRLDFHRRSAEFLRRELPAER